jgi:hypothetical protein
MEARQAQAADWEALRQLRLAALADAPDAFASTLEAELAFPTELWQQRAHQGVAHALVDQAVRWGRPNAKPAR